MERLLELIDYPIAAVAIIILAVLFQCSWILMWTPKALQIEFEDAREPMLTEMEDWV